MRIRSPRHVEYLSLEGGGGKGVTYLGAIRALEALRVLPIDISDPGGNQIKGISGASAGAITAMMLAMGMTSKDIEEILSTPVTFTEFFDGPSPGVYRSVSRSNEPVTRREKPEGTSTREFVRERADAIGIWPHVVSVGAAVFRQFAAVDDPMARRLVQAPEEYIYNLVYDRGLFPGFAPRRFLTGLVISRLREKIQSALGGVIANVGGSIVDFERFHEFTGVDLVITGANLTRHRPAVFSRRHTPNFPVAEAVGISMNLPMLFKPVHVEADVPRSELNEREDDYHGFWVDGGLLNNFPLHAFDHLGPSVSSRYPLLRPLHPGMLGLRLTDVPRPSVPATPGVFDVLKQHLGNLVGALLHPSEQGQIRSPEEVEQTIDLLTYDLSTTEFAPSKALSRRPIKEAEARVRAYFGRRGGDAAVD